MQGAFFIAATLHGTVSIGLWAFMRPSHANAAAWHGHELIFGYSLAVIAGFLLTKLSARAASTLLLLWGSARLAWLVPAFYDLGIASLLSVLATIAIASIAVRQFLRGMKREQNSVFPIILILLGVADLVAQLAGQLGAGVLERQAILLGVFTVVSLIAMMGGRLAGAAFSGLAQRAGGARIPPNLRREKMILIALAASATSHIFDAHALIAATSCFAAGGGMLWRLYEWRRGLLLAGVDLLPLAASQGFIALGLIGLGLHGFAPPWPADAPLHFITIGGIGLTTAIMMLKTTAQRDRGVMPRRSLIVISVSLGVAALLRGFGFQYPEAVYPLSAAFWLLAMATSLAALTFRPVTDGSPWSTPS